MKTWLTVAEAATLVSRHPSAIYRWIEKHRLRPADVRPNPDGAIEVRSDAVRVAAGEIRRGRPRREDTR